MSSPARSSEATGPPTRVLYLITNDISARFLRGQLGNLIEHGFEVAVGTSLSDPPAAFDERVAVHDIEFRREPHLRADAASLWATVRLMRTVRPEIVNASTPKAGLLGMVAAWCCRVPMRVYVVRGLRFETLTGARRRLFRWLERLATACATDVIYNSSSLLGVAERERAVRRGRGRVLGAGSGNGIDVARFDDLPSREAARAALGLETDARVVGFVGRLTRDKGVVDLVEAFRDADDGPTLLIVGDYEAGDPVPDDTRQRIESSADIVHVPWIEDTRPAYRAMDVLAFPSYREGLPNVPLEAQLCGVPVMGYAATGTVDAIEHLVGGLLVPVGDRDALRDGLETIVSGESDAQLGVAGSAWVRSRFDQPALWSRLEQVYRGACSALNRRTERRTYRYDVVVTVATFRRNALLEQTLTSLMIQSIDPERLAIVVADNDPEQGAREAVAAFQGSTPRVEYVAEPRPGIAAARNRAVNAALDLDPTWIAFIDDDERADPRWLEELLRAADGADAAQGSVDVEFEAGGPDWVRRSDFYERPVLTDGQRLRFGTTANLIVRADVLSRLEGPFDDAFGLVGGSDTEMTLRLTNAGGTLVAAPHARVVDFIPLGRQNVEWLRRRTRRKASLGVHFERTLMRTTGWRTRRLLAAARWTAVGAFQKARGRMSRDELTLVSATLAFARVNGIAIGLGGRHIAEYERS